MRLSPKHGVNAAIPLCFYCCQPKQEIILAGKLPRRRDKNDSDPQAPQGAIWDMLPCAACQGYMKEGVILISVRDGEKGANPYRTGGWAVVRDEAIKRCFKDPIKHLLEMRFAFVEDHVWETLGLPRGET